MANIKLEAKNRTGLGKNCTDKIRAEKNIPAAIFEKGEETKPITVSSRDFDVVYKEAGATSIVDVVVEGKVYPTIIKEVDKHPFKNQILHVNFQGVKMDELVKVEVPIEFHNRDNIRVQPSVFTALLNTIHVECLPGDIPESVIVDVQDMQLDDVIYVKDLEIAKNKKVTVLLDMDEIVCSLSHEKEETEEVETEVVAGEVPLVDEEAEEN